MAHWTCPYCNRDATLIPKNVSENEHPFHNDNKDGYSAIITKVIVCPNTACREYAISLALHRYEKLPGTNSYRLIQPAAMNIMIKPQSAAKPIADYIPTVIRQDYEEACLIASLSPKASATLSRRCLQGMIRDFWKISKPRLIDEIKALEGTVDATTWEAIDAVRKLGNIGAHMEKDINVIVDVDENEAQLLIGLIETLIDDWYVHRHQRETRMSAVIAAANSKKQPQSLPAQPTPSALPAPNENG